MPGSPALAHDVVGLNSHSEGPLLAGPLLGEVTAGEARIWAQARDASPLTLRLFSADGQREWTVQPTAEEFLCVVLCADGLVPGASYEYALASAHGETPRYRFRVPPSPEARRLRLAFGSCYKDYRSPALPIFDAIAAESPDAFLMAGDTCYFDDADWQDEASRLRAHLRNRNHPSLRPLVATVPTLGVWDDHDFGPNDSDGTFAGKGASLRTFLRMWAQRSYGLPDVPGIFSTVRLGPVEVFLLDVRYHRHERQHILGEEQLGWLTESLANSAAPVKLCVSGSQVLPEVAGTPPFNWECFSRDAPRELEALLGFIEQRDVRGVVFLSGDPHLGYVLRVPGRPLADGRRGPDFVEITSSPLANKPWSSQVMPADSADHPRFDHTVRVELVTQNFGLIDVDLDRAGAEVVLSLHGADGAALYTQPLSLAQLAVRPPQARLAAAVVGPERAYLFRGSEYVRCNPQHRAVDPGYPRAIANAWPGAWPAALGPGFDAALAAGHNRLYFFKGNGYSRYDLGHDKGDPGYPKYIPRHWAGLWPGDLDAAFLWPGSPAGKAYFLRGGECIRYDLGSDRADPGYPRPLAEEFAGVFPAGVDAALAWPDGAVYFLRGDECVRYDPAAGRASEPYLLTEGWLGFLPPA